MYFHSHFYSLTLILSNVAKESSLRIIYILHDLYVYDAFYFLWPALKIRSPRRGDIFEEAKALFAVVLNSLTFLTSL
jgi:hypothetical protein